MHVGTIFGPITAVGKVLAGAFGRSFSLTQTPGTTYRDLPPARERSEMYQTAIEELLDAIYYLTRQVAKLEDLRQRLVAVTCNRSIR